MNPTKARALAAIGARYVHGRSRTVRAAVVLILLGLIAIPVDASAQSFPPDPAYWLTEPSLALSPAQYAELRVLETADDAEEGLSAYPHDQQFAAALMLGNFLDEAEHTDLMERIGERIEAGENASAKIRWAVYYSDPTFEHPNLGIERIEAAVKLAAAEKDLDATAYALAQRAFLEEWLERYEDLEKTYRLLAELNRRMRKTSTQAYYLIVLAELKYVRGSPGEASRLLDDADIFVGEHSNLFLRAYLHQTRGIIAAHRKDSREALRQFIQARNLYLDMPNWITQASGLCTVYLGMGNAYLEQGKIPAARRKALDAIQSAVIVGDGATSGMAYQLLTQLEMNHEEDLAAARTYADLALLYLQTGSDSQSYAGLLLVIADLCLLEADLQGAQDHLREARDLYVAIGLTDTSEAVDQYLRATYRSDFPMPTPKTTPAPKMPIDDPGLIERAGA
ncbi:MAG: hypothetical protein AAF916_03405 [Planctomycetota bacterium]